MARLDSTLPDALSHSGTYNNNVLTMAAGIAGLERVYTPEAVARLNSAGDRLRDGLQLIADRREVPVAVTGRGSMLCIHFRRGSIDNPGDVAQVPIAARKLLHLDMMLRGFYIARRGFLSLCLPLTETDYAGFCGAFDAFLGENAAVLIEAIAARIDE